MNDMNARIRLAPQKRKSCQISSRIPKIHDLSLSTCLWFNHFGLVHTPQSMAKAEPRNFHALRSCMGPSCIDSFVPCSWGLTVLCKAQSAGSCEMTFATDERRKIEVLQISLATRCCAASNNMICFLLNATSTHMEQENHALQTALTTNNMSQPIPTIPLDPFSLIPALLGLSFCGDRYVRLLDYCC